MWGWSVDISCIGGQPRLFSQIVAQRNINNGKKSSYWLTWCGTYNGIISELSHWSFAANKSRKGSEGPDGSKERRRKNLYDVQGEHEHISTSSQVPGSSFVTPPKKRILNNYNIWYKALKKSLFSPNARQFSPGNFSFCSMRPQYRNYAND